MIDFSEKIWGVALWIWLYFIINNVTVTGIMIYLFKEKVRKVYYQIKFPEKIIKVVIHYPTGMYRQFYRLIPEEKTFSIDKKRYGFDDKLLIKNNDFYAHKNYNDNSTTINIKNKTYNFETEAKIKYRWDKYPEIHYFYNVPNPIKFDIEQNEIKFNALQLEEFQENDLFKKLLTLRDEQRFLMIIAVITGLTLVGVVLMALRMFEVI